MRRAGFLLIALLLAAGASARETTYVYPPPKHTLGFERVGNWELKLFLGMGASYANPQGLAAVKLKAQDDPDDKGDDVFLTLFAVNSDLGEIVYNPTRFEVGRYGRRGTGRGEFLRPLGIAANEDGQVAVADTGNRRVVFLAMGESGLQWEGTAGEGQQGFCPVDLAWGGGVFWCLDASQGCIFRFSGEGELLGRWPLADGATLESPRGLCVLFPEDDWVRSGDFALLVVDRDGQRLQLFDRRGRLMQARMLDQLMEPPGQFTYPVGDLYGQFVLADSVKGRLLKLDPRLQPLDLLETVDDDSRPFQHPRGLAIWRRFGQLFVAEEEGGAYLWTGTDLRGARVSRGTRNGRESLLLEYFLTEPSLVSVYARVQGQEIRISAERRRGRGDRRHWLPLDDTIRGADDLVIKARPSYSAKKILTVTREIPLEGRF